jgi:integrase
MPHLKHRQPAYRLHKASKQAIVSLSGQIHYLGAWNSPESREKYDRLVGEWLTRGRSKPQKPAEPEKPGTEPGKPETTVTQTTIAELVLAYWTHAKTHYRGADGKPTQELQNVHEALKPLQRLYGDTPARSFGPLALRALRDSMVRSGTLARTTINARINRVRRCFKWGASVEMIPATVFEALKTVDGLQRGRTVAREPDPVKPVALEVVEATLPFLPRPVAAMVRLQLLTGMRAGEVEIMRGCDLTPGEPLWEYRPASHKGSWRGKSRVIPLGPRAVEIVREFLTTDTTAYLFDPREAANPHLIARTKKRYHRRSYDQAIARACDRASPHPTLVEMRTAIKATPLGGRKKAWKELRRWEKEHAAELAQWREEHRWSPLQLRHTTATMVRSKYGLEAAQTVLGHAKADVTQIYAERDLGKAREIAEQIG